MSGTDDYCLECGGTGQVENLPFPVAAYYDVPVIAVQCYECTGTGKPRNG